jgi:hypothetical protein
MRLINTWAGLGADLVVAVARRTTSLACSERHLSIYTTSYPFNASFLIPQLQAKDSLITLLATATVLQRQFNP